MRAKLLGYTKLVMKSGKQKAEGRKLGRANLNVLRIEGKLYQMLTADSTQHTAYLGNESQGVQTST